MTGSVPVLNIVKSLTLTVVCPLLVGQLIRPYIRTWMERTNPPLNSIGSFMLLMIIYTTFCDTFSSDVNAIDPMELIILSATIVFIQVNHFLAVDYNFLCWYVSKILIKPSTL